MRLKDYAGILLVWSFIGGLLRIVTPELPVYAWLVFQSGRGVLWLGLPLVKVLRQGPDFTEWWERRSASGKKLGSWRYLVQTVAFGAIATGLGFVLGIVTGYVLPL